MPNSRPPRMRIEATRVVFGSDGLAILPAYDDPEYPDRELSPYQPPTRQVEEAVRILDERGNAQYIVTVLDRGSEQPPALTAIWFRAPLRGAMERASVEGSEWLSDAQLAAHAVSFLRRRDAEISTGRVIPGFTERVELRDQTRTPLPRPELAQIAAEARLAQSAGEPIAAWLSDHYSVSTATAERWIRAARLSNHLPPARAGRPRKTNPPTEGANP